MNDVVVLKLRCEYLNNPVGLDSVKPRLSWQLASELRGVYQSSYRIQVSLGPIFSVNRMVWDSGIVQSEASIHVPYGGPPLLPRTRYCYRVMAETRDGRQSDWSEPAFWETGLLGAEEWAGAEWIGADIPDEASPYLRREFQLSGAITEARVYATAQGLYSLFMNGQPVSDALFTPGWTSYNKRLQYQTYDVTPLVTDGANAIGVILGNGWFKGNLAWGGQKAIYGSQLAALIQLHIRYGDGREEVLYSGPDWKWSTGPILMSEIYHGETYDARLELGDWTLPDYDDSSWPSASVFRFPKEQLTGQENVPVRVVEELSPIAVIKTPRGETVLDMGQNMVGWIRFCVEAPRGTEIRLKHAEVLDAEGNFFTANLRNAQQTVTYTCKGTGTEAYEPRFTFQGFRYVLVEGYPGEPALEHFTGKVIHSDMEQTGAFACSNPSVNQLQHNIVWGQKGNFLDVPTDCPQRDERLGWTGDAQMFIRTAAYNMGTASFFTKWLRDLKADQLPDGGVPSVIPDVLKNASHSSAAWGDAAVICPWTLYLCYGDIRILEEQFDSMKAWVEYIRNQGNEPYLWNTGEHFGDWLALDAKENSYIGATPRDLIATAFFAYSCGLVAKAAAVLKREAEAKEYKELHQEIKQAFRAEFVTPRGRLAANTQTAHVLALMFDLLEDKDRLRAADDLEKLIRDEKIHLTTGFVGTPYLCHVLTASGRNDLAYELLLQRDYPSWLYAVDKGATTIWEHWDGIKTDGTFWSDDMNSYNHYTYGAVGDWLYRSVAGINLLEEAPGYNRILLAPMPGGGLTWVRASLDTMYGKVGSSWSLDEAAGRMRTEFAVPGNTSAVAVLPAAAVEAITESGSSLAAVSGVRILPEASGGIVLELDSGSYVFEFPYKA
jgi:alpha-L-rhamnosidase